MYWYALFFFTVTCTFCVCALASSSFHITRVCWILAQDWLLTVCNGTMWMWKQPQVRLWLRHSEAPTFKWRNKRKNCNWRGFYSFFLILSSLISILSPALSNLTRWSTAFFFFHFTGFPCLRVKNSFHSCSSCWVHVLISFNTDTAIYSHNVYLFIKEQYLYIFFIYPIYHLQILDLHSKF